MSPKPLSIVAAFGLPRTKPMLLAAHPDEEHLPSGEPAPDRRTLLLELDGVRARFVGVYDAPLMRAWMSSNGTAYCSSIGSTAMHLFRDGSWTTEAFSPEPVSMFADLFGFSGETQAEDLVFATSPGKLFVRRGGQWAAHRAPKDMILGSVHGRDPDHMFVGGENLLRFNGKKLRKIESPDHSVRTVRVTDDDRLIGGWDFLSITNPDGSWQAIETQIKDFMDLAEFRGEVYAGTFDEGVLRVYPGPVTRSSARFAVTRLIDVGDALLAVDEGLAHVFDGETWQEVQVPSCEPGKTPNASA